MILESPVVGKLRSLVREISETATPLDEQVAFQREHFVASLLVFLPEPQRGGAANSHSFPTELALAPHFIVPGR
jgi:hypothetical protein